MPAATLYSSTSLYEKVEKRIESPLIKLFSFASRWLTDVTIENTNKYNSHILIAIRDILLEKWFGEGQFVEVRAKAIRAMFNFIISKYDRDNTNGGYLDDFFAEKEKHDWQYKADFGKSNHLQKALVEALSGGEYDKVLGLID